MSDSARATTPVAEEQEFVDRAYSRLDQLRSQYREQRQKIDANHGVGNAQGWTERDALATHFAELSSRLDNVEERLVFGRLDMKDHATHYIGRISLLDEHSAPLLVDWRAPISAPFYQATAQEPLGVVRRRHIATRARTVTSVEDELLDVDQAQHQGLTLQGEGALMSALSSARSGRMGDIVATIQGEQDRVIRASDRGILVVQGGPGTGKTAVALHRAAYLLYTQRERLERSGVLIIGPSRTFLRYIEQVLPSLGESGVVQMTIGDIVPGLSAQDDDPVEIAAIKGRAAFSRILREAVRLIPRLPDRDQVLQVWNRRVTLRVKDVQEALSRARRSGRPHNVARESFAMGLMELLAGRLIVEAGDASSTADIDPDDLRTWMSEIRDSVDARRAINLAWMPTQAPAFLRKLWSRPDLLAQANRKAGTPLSVEDLSLLYRAQDEPLTISDIPLIDELEELLGTLDLASAQKRRAEEQREKEERERANEALKATGLGGGIVTADMLMRQTQEAPSLRPLAERARADRSWTYGHIVIDEAQDLSPMAWRCLLRRCPSRSMTVVGDLDQKRGHRRPNSWKQALGPAARAFNEEFVLSISYRTPRALTRIAQAVMAQHGTPVLYPMEAVRDVPDCYQVSHTHKDTLKECVSQIVSAMEERLDREEGEGKGRICVIVPDAQAQLWHADESGASALDQRVSYLTAAGSKGLEFDSVVVVEPGAILDQGSGDLFVALTRATHDLHAVTTTQLPRGMEEWDA
ncbi:MAG: AAA family ATPase [Actinomyces sp. oral taxon 181]|uniref:HelD family protein n=1 Tax=Actinomyces sp. oral taxon 181 TaxID=712121 RepID=UPI0025C664F4|nr:AAA family ATPase [Actinomyces sp. oral taxon 181]MBS4796159.1 AAA family ATPase [Actinomyces sp. oral taxon 181]